MIAEKVGRVISLSFYITSTEGRKEMFYLTMCYFTFFSQCSTTGVTKAWDDAYKRTLAVNRKE